ncbi:hypothetical protein [Pseudotabrizicola formosa]|uniref:hypothetical protein n=1 Tax=Pseudotabrizicola formosa TaxID=2030009 RepID=UPI0011AFAA42|nr:hypothetical protein [Pseudotabrizicola formosa]
MTKSMFGNTARKIDADPERFVQVAEDLHLTLSQLDGAHVSLGWEGMTTAIFTVADVRIVLRTANCPGDALTHLTVAVDLSSDGSPAGLGSVCEETCASVIDHLQRRYPGVTTVKHRPADPVAPSVQDHRLAAVASLPQKPGVPAFEGVSDGLASDGPDPEKDTGALPAQLGDGPIAPRQSTRASVARSKSAGARARAASARARGGAYFATSGGANGPFPRIVDEPSLPESHNVAFARVRSAFNYVEPEAPPPRLSTPLRLTTHALNASLIMVWAPLGAGVMAYALVKGENTRFSGQMVVLTGLFAAALNTPIGQYMSAMIGA